MPDAAFHGVFPHLVSPVIPSGEVMDEALNRLCNDLIAAGVHGLAALGSTGEFAYLRWPQRRRIVEVVVNAANSRVPACVMLIGKGWMAGPACIVPKQSVVLYECCRSGDWGAAIKLQRELWSINEVFMKYNFAACIKCGLELQGYRRAASATVVVVVGRHRRNSPRVG
jgi:dihydrodipicolinate synthase/N-acetylneuraminate lyase